MKAILVIDVPSDYGDIADNKAIVTLRNDKLGTSLRIHNVSLKQMPEKKELANYLPFEDYPQQIRFMDFVNGWNACLEKITGETE